MPCQETLEQKSALKQRLNVTNQSLNSDHHHFAGHTDFCADASINEPWCKIQVIEFFYLHVYLNNRLNGQENDFNDGKITLTLPKRQIFYPSKEKEFTDHSFRFDENSEKFSKRVENTVGKWEIARYEQFLLFPQCFQKNCHVKGEYICRFHVSSKS